MRILIRTSKFAIWARRFGSLALPLAVLPVLMHRERLITSENFQIIALIAIGIAALAVVLALIAFARLWVTGDQGWNRALIGMVLGFICLAPPAFLIWQHLRQPMPQDFSTDLRDPPPLLSAAVSPAGDADAVERAFAAFPNARARTYPVDAMQVFELVSLIVVENGWEVRVRNAPAGALGVGQLNALAMRPLGWRDELAIRVAGRADGASVDMRSRSQDGALDVGGNGQRIEQFLLALDARITRLMRDLPTGTSAEETEAPPTQGTNG